MHLSLTRLLLAIAYPLLAHWASIEDDTAISGAVAALALADLVLIVLLQPLAARRGWAWLLLAAIVAALVPLAHSRYAQLPLLAPPMLFTGALAWWFGRSLRAARVPVITRFASALEQLPPADLPPALQRYTRRLTAAWACLLGALALTNGVLALIAVPGGVLARLGHPPAWSIDPAQWSLFANFLDYGIVAAFFIGEYIVRGWLFPQRPYRSFFDFVRRMAAVWKSGNWK